MRAVLRGLWTSDSEDPREFVPTDPTEFGLHLRAMIGPADADGEESFDFLACTPAWLESQQLDKGFRWGHGVLVMRRWDVEVLDRAVRDLVLHAEGASWDAISQRLARFTDWEFTDYSPEQ